MTRDEALVILDSGDFDRFVGVEEDLEVEFKGEPYQLHLDAEKFELAKDASALANARGGLIVIGVRTTRHAETPVDVADAVRQLGRGLVDEERYLDVIGNRVYPRIDGVRVRFFEGEADEANTEEGRGLAVIDVPPQDQDQKYFLVHRPVGGEEKTPGWLIGIAIRSGGRVDEQRIGEIHALINRGLNVSRQLSDLAASMEQLQQARQPLAPPEDNPAERLAGVVAQRYAELGPPMTTEPLLVIAAAATQATSVGTFTQAEGVRTLLERPPESRHSGFNLRTYDRASLVGGTRLSVSGGNRLQVDLIEDGTLLAYAAFNEFLAWGRGNFFERPKVNGLAVVEFVYDFVLLYARIVADHFEPRPTRVRFYLGVRGSVVRDEDGTEKRLFLSPGPLVDFPLPYGDEEAPDAGLDWTTEAEVGDADPPLDVGGIAYRLVQRFYNWFGHTDDAVPYTNDEQSAIDIEQIKALR